MSSIPTVVSPRLTPPPEMNPSIVPARVLAQSGEEWEQVSSLGVEVSNRIRKAQDEGIMLDAENKISADIEQAHAQLANWTDYTHADELKQQTADTLKQKYTDLYGNKPYLWRYIEPFLGKELNSYNSVVDQKSAQLTAHFNKAALIDSQLRAESDAANEVTIEGKERVWAEQDAKTDIMVKNGTMWSDEAEVAKKLLRSRTITTEVDRASNPINPPEVMRQELDKLKTYADKGYVDPETLERLTYHLSRSLEVAENRSDRIDVAKQGDGIIAGYRADPTLKDPETRQFDHMAAARKVDDDPDVPTKVKKYVRQEMEEEAGAVQKENNDRDQKMLDELDPHVESGQLTFRELSRRENLPPGSQDWIPRRVADHLMTRAAQIQRENRTLDMQARSEMRQERMEKSADLRDELLSQPGYIADQNELTQYRLKGLSAGDANIVWKAKALNSDPAWGLAVKMMQSSSVYNTQTDEGKAKLSKDLIGFAKTVETKQLQGDQIIKATQDQLDQEKAEQNKGTIKGWLDNIFHWNPLLPNNNLPQPKPVQQTPQPTSRKEYFDGMKRANPLATDAEINAYLDKRGIK